MMSITVKELRHQVGQLLIMGLEGTEATPRLHAIVTHLQPGGSILFQRNIVSAEQCHQLNTALQTTARIPLFRCIDLEGGTVDRLRVAIAPSPSQFEVASSGEQQVFHRFGKLLGEMAWATGFNVNFAPVSDLGLENSRSVLGSRTVSSSAKETIAFVREFLKGLHSAGVLGCGKHFPGLGEAGLDSHHDLPMIHKDWKSLWEEDLLPYRELKREYPFVMVAHAAYPNVSSSKMPASLSRKWITDVLKKKIGYRGVVLSDDLEMGGVLAAGTIDQAAVETLRAGADMFLVCHKEENILAAYEAVLREAERDRRFRTLIAGAARKVTKIKSRMKRAGKLSPPPVEEDIRQFRKEITQLQSQLHMAGVTR